MYDLVTADLVRKPGQGLGFSIVTHQNGVFISDIVCFFHCIARLSLVMTMRVFFQHLSVVVQRFNSILLHDSFSVNHPN